jgi:hypothetical protein
MQLCVPLVGVGWSECYRIQMAIYRTHDAWCMTCKALQVPDATKQS